ncbi:Non-ribosomal peptide [Aspergillus sclerotialis]|uniref:Non-ribosomal peptide n=1 Tax=Aspergillus sclerotialis TaxID=2070753 RepID=A0A3A3A1Y9_9EURO|nr:Non-ribosomal peptide [Aspergillus sclerotialis]
MPSTVFDDSGRLHQRWTQLVTDVTPSNLPLGSFAKRQTRSPTGQLNIRLDLPLIQACCQQCDVSPLSLVEAAWTALLRLYTGSEDVIFGGIGLGRPTQKQQWTNTSMCRAQLDLDASIVSVPSKLKEEGLPEAECIISVPEAMKVFSSLEPKPCNSAIWLRSPTTKDDFQLHILNEGAFDYVLQIDPSLSTLGLMFYKPTVSRSQAEYVASTFSDLLHHLCVDPYQSVASVCQLSELDTMQLEVWNHKIPEGTQACVDRLIEKTAKATPDLPALVSWEGELTFSQFNQLASGLARYFDSVGIKRGQLVPILFEKSMWTIVTMLALWKLGAAYVPLDPRHPIHRIQVIISAVEATAVVASAAQEPILKGNVPQLVVVDSAVMHEITSSADVEFPSRSQPTDPAFVMFTSGSTGKPKGVLHLHHSVCSSALHHGPAMNISSATRALQFGAYTFIISTFEMFTPLIMGGALCIPSDHDRHTDIRPFLRAKDVNWAIFTPSFARSLPREDAPSMKTLILAGEPVAQDIIDRWAAEACLINIYGSSECSVCMIGRMSPTTPRTCIGRATGTLSWIVDPNDHDRLLPIGSVGELVIEGPTLASGYLGEPERTKSVYIENPVWARQNGVTRRFYKTGDLAQYGDDGAVHLIGRKDLQVKIRGQRVELTEIEANLRAINNEVKTAVAMVRPGGKAMLVAFIASQSGFGPEFSYRFHDEPEDKSRLSMLSVKMSEQLTEMLPPYMIPSAFIPLAYMPLTASGKTDRKMVSSFADGLTLSQLASVAGNSGQRRMPSTSAEIKLQHIWADLLHCPPDEISAEDNFFHLGGDSIEAMNLSRRCRAEGYKLQVGDILGNLVLSNMANVMIPATSPDRVTPKPFELVKGNRNTIRMAVQAATGWSDPDVIQDAYPCTPLQEGLMALSSKISGSYIARHTLELPSNVNIKHFQDIWQSIVSGNDVLRTRIVDTDEYGKLQVVTRGSIEWKQGNSLPRYLEADESSPMQMGDTLARHAIIVSDRIYYVLTIHHAIYDGISLEMLFDDLNQALRGGAPTFRPQFRDFMQHVLETNNDQSTQEFWRKELPESDLTPFPTLPSATHQAVANSSLIHEISVDRNPSDFTTATLLRAAWSLLQARYCDAPETVFGCTLSGRNAPVAGVEDIVGPVIATVPIKVHLDPQQPVLEFLKNVQNHSVQMAPFQNYGLQNIARVSEAAAAACNFQTLMVIQPAHVMPEDSVLEPFSSPRARFSTVALTIECTLGANGVSIHMHFDDAVLEHSQVVRMAQQFEHVFRQLAAQQSATEPIGKIADIEMISPQDMQDIIRWNPAPPATVDDCIHHLIGQHAVKNPDAPAICSHDGSLTYGELERVSSNLAVHLINSGVGPEIFVPLCFEKSMWTIVAMLGVMKAGGAFVPMEPSQPESRLQLVIREVNAHIMLCSEEQLARCPGLVEKAIAVGPGWAEMSLPSMATSLGATSVTPSNAAYIIFTSGSTGTPKGSLVEHRAFCTGALAHKEGLQMGRRVLQFASYTFDASILEILSTLIQGSCVCVPSESERRGNIAEAISRMNVDWAVLTPSFASTIDPSTVPSLEVLALAGEAMTAAHISAWTPYVRLVNGYGPSECCVCSTSNRKVVPGTAPNDIGSSVGSACWVADRENHEKLAPIGCIGELLVEANTLARHYLNNPEKTAAAFIQRPSWLGKDRCERLYKTGDLVKQTPDGSLLFVGRKDTQVKIRGQRVELGEIEYHLSTPSEVAQAVVAYPKGGIYAKKLIAILELSSTAGTDLTQVPTHRVERTGFDMSSLARYMSETLPGHMVPTIWIVVGKIPMSASTKIDRKTVDNWLARLPSDFEPTMGISRETPALAKLGIEERKAMALSEKIANLVGRTDDTALALQGRDFNIAATGIDSVQVISLASFIKQTYGVKVEVGRILDGQTTVRSLADLIDGELSGNAPTQVATVDVMKEASTLIKDIMADTPTKKTVFVTGVTGFLGSQLLRQLLDRPDVGRVIAHVRASNEQDALIRLRDASQRAQWWSEQYLFKLDVWAGNLAKPRLGLTPKQWAFLTGQCGAEGLVDAIIHAGAAVNWNAGCEVLRAANVTSTAELIKAAVSSPVKPRFVYVSGGHRWNVAEKDHEIAQEVAGANGYAQTKYISELLVKHFATTHPGQFAIIKPGLIIGTPEEGVANTDDFIWRLASGVVDVKGFSGDYGDSWMFITSSTRVAEETVYQAFCRPQNVKTVTFMTDGVTEREFWDIFIRDLKYPMRPMNHQSWMETMKYSIQKEGSTHPLWPVVGTFEAIGGRLGGDPLPDTEMISPSQKQHVKASIRRNIKFLVEAGFVASPSGKKSKYDIEKVFQRSGNVWENVKGMVNGLRSP